MSGEERVLPWVSDAHKQRSTPTPHAVAITSLSRAFAVMKSMAADELECGEEYRCAGRQALKEVIEGRMCAAVEQHL